MYNESATWGIPSETFLVVYVAAAVVAVGLAVFLRSRGTAPTPTAGIRLDPVQAGMLTSDDRAAAASLTLLRGADLISADGTVLRGWGVADNALGSFTRAVYDELASGRSALGNLRLPGRLQAPLDHLRSTLVAQGLLDGSRTEGVEPPREPPDPRRRGRRRRTPRRRVRRRQADRLPAGRGGSALGRAGARSPDRTQDAPGHGELQRLRRDHSYLSPRMRPSLTAYGPTPIALSTALFGYGGRRPVLPGFRERGRYLRQRQRGRRQRRRRRQLVRRRRGLRRRRRVRRMTPLAERGVGIGWRPEIAGFVAELPGLRFVEVVAESLPRSASRCRRRWPALRERGRRGRAARGASCRSAAPSRSTRHRVAHLAALRRAVGAPLVSEHIAFVRAGGVEAGHLLPVPRSRGGGRRGRGQRPRAPRPSCRCRSRWSRSPRCSTGPTTS